MFQVSDKERIPFDGLEPRMQAHDCLITSDATVPEGGMCAARIGFRICCPKYSYRFVMMMIQVVRSIRHAGGAVSPKDC
jgi:hypothetical protein